MVILRPLQGVLPEIRGEKIKAELHKQQNKKHDEWGLNNQQQEKQQLLIDNDMKEFVLNIVPNTHSHTANWRTVTAEVLMIIIKK